MGTKAAPSSVNLVMGHLEITHVYTYPKQPLLWLLFIDNIFMIWTHNPDELKKFIDHLNQVHPTLKFTFESSPTQVSFLDTWVKMEDNFLYTDLFVKPTDTHMYLHYNSCHPKHSKSGGPYSQLLRVKRICSRLWLQNPCHFHHPSITTWKGVFIPPPGKNRSCPTKEQTFTPTPPNTTLCHTPGWTRFILCGHIPPM